MKNDDAYERFKKDLSRGAWGASVYVFGIVFPLCIIMIGFTLAGTGLATPFVVIASVLDILFLNAFKKVFKVDDEDSNSDR